MKRFTQSMLVVLMALFGLNLQAGAAVKTYDFAAAAASAESDVTLTASERAAGSNNMGTALVFPNELQDLLQDQFGFFFRGECTVSLSKAEGGLTMVGTKDTYMSVLNLKAGDKVTVTYSTGTILFCDKAGSNNPEGLTNVEGITEQWAPLNSGQAYTMLVDGHFNFQWKKAKTVITKIEIESSAAAESGATFDFNALDVATSSGSNETLTHDGDITEPYVQTVDGVTLTVSPAAEDAKNPNRFWGTNAGPQLRCYSGTITLESATAFKSIEFDATSNFNLTPDVGELNATTWSGDATKVVFTVNRNTQINKIVVSSEAAVTPEPPVIVAATIADFKALEKGTEAKLTLKDAFVTAVSGSNAYVQDATGALYFYNSGLTFVAGTKLNGSVMGKLDIYNSLPEFTKSADTNADDITATDGVATPKNIAVAQVEENISMLVKLTNVTIAEDGGKYYVVDGETKYQIYDQFKVLAEGFTYPEKADIVAIVGMYKGTPQLYPLDANSISEAASAPDPNFREVTVNVDRYPGLGYGVTDAQADLSIAKKWLGVDTLTYDMLRIENPNGELISDYAPFDGWFNGDGVAENWGDNTKICVKFFQALQRNGQFEICDMNGADEVGKTYSVKWQLVSGEKAVRYTINVQFVEKPTLDLTFADLNVKGEFTTAFTSQTGSYYEGLKSDVDVPAILAAAGAASLDDVAIYAVQSDGSLDDNYKLGTGTTDGWRNAAGDWQGWGANAYFYVKADFSRESEQLYEVGGMDPSQNANMNVPGSYTATYAFVKKGTADAAVLKVTLTYTAPDGIETATMTTGSESTIYNLRGQQVEKPTKGLYIVNGKKVVIK